MSMNDEPTIRLSWVLLIVALILAASTGVGIVVYAQSWPPTQESVETAVDHHDIVDMQTDIKTIKLDQAQMWKSINDLNNDAAVTHEDLSFIKSEIGGGGSGFLALNGFGLFMFLTRRKITIGKKNGQ